MNELVIPLTSNEIADYKRAKYRIQSGLEDVARALEEVRNRRLYREEYPTFEDFCRTELGKSKTRINQLIVAAHVNETLTTNGFHQVNERVARELSKLSTPEQRSIVLAAAMATAPNGEPTAEHVRSTVIVIKGLLANGGHVDTGNGESTPLAEAIVLETHERKLRQQQHIRDNRRGVVLLSRVDFEVVEVTDSQLFTIRVSDAEAHRRFSHFAADHEPRLRLSVWQESVQE